MAGHVQSTLALLTARKKTGNWRSLPALKVLTTSATAEAVSAFEGWRFRVGQRSCRGSVRDEILDEFRYERGLGLQVAEAV